MLQTPTREQQAQTEIVLLLQKHFDELRLRRAGFSLRAFSKRLGLSPAALSEVLNGKRPVTRKMAAKLLGRLGVDPEPAQELLEKLPQKNARKPNPVATYFQLSTDEFRVVADWYYLAILSLSETSGFESDPAWIANRLGITKREATSALDTLMRLGLLGQDLDGRLFATGKKFTTTNDIPDTSIRKNHAQGLELAREALDEVPVELREFSASIIAADPDLLPEAKQRLRKLRREIAQLLESGKKREVYRLSVQLIPLTKVKGDLSS